MSRSDGMQEVELVVVPEAAAEPGAVPADDDRDRRRRRRRAVLRWWPLGLVAVVAVAGTQLALDARERARVAAARELPGVVGYDVGPELTVEASAPDDVPGSGVAVGDLQVLGEDTVSGEPRAVHAVDASGAEVWRTEVEDAVRAAEIASIDAPWCSAGTPPVTRVRCFVQDSPTTELGSDGWQIDPPVRSRLLTLDGRTGAVLAERELAPLARAVVVDDDLLVAEVLADGVRVAVEDATTGEVRWATELPVDARALAGIPDMSPFVHATDAHVVVQLSQQSWSLDRADGRVEATGSALWVGRGERLIGTGLDDGLTRLHGADGSGDVLAVGSPLQLQVDDGSVPELDLLSDTRQGHRWLHAVDPRTGEQVWEHAFTGPAESSPVLLGGVLYGADGAAVWALDAADGTEIWRTLRDVEAGDVAGDASVSTWFAPLTDGRQLLLVEYDDDGATARLSAWSLASGAYRWTTALPPEADGSVAVWEGVLHGSWPDYVRLR